MSERTEAFTFLAVLVVLSWLFIFSVVHAIVGMTADKQCLKYGFPSSSVSWSFQRYCIKRINQTDSVVPLSILNR